MEEVNEEKVEAMEMAEKTSPESEAEESEEDVADVEKTEVGVTEAEVAAMVAEAEARGYLRGRNEVISQMMREPPLFANQAMRERAPARSEESDASAEFLAHIRPQVWD